MATMNTKIIGASSKALLKAGLFISFITACIVCVNLFGKCIRNPEIVRMVISEKSDFSSANLQKLQKDENKDSGYTGISDEFEDVYFDDTQRDVETSFDYAALSVDADNGLTMDTLVDDDILDGYKEDPSNSFDSAEDDIENIGEIDNKYSFDEDDSDNIDFTNGQSKAEANKSENIGEIGNQYPFGDDDISKILDYTDIDSEDVDSPLVARPDNITGMSLDYSDFDREMEDMKAAKEAEEAKCRRLPDIVIVAFEKCGTMTLRQFLAIHPSIYINNKRGNNRLFISEDDDIKKLYENFSCTPDHKLRLEKLATPTRADLVYKYLPDIKIIAIVREPVERSMSQFLHLKARGKMKKSITDFEVYAKIDVPVKSEEHGIRFSYYRDTIRPWVETYGQENILFLDGDEFAKNPVNELQKAEQFIGLRPFITANMFEYNESRGFYCIKTTRDDGCMYPGKGRPHPVMREETREYLKEAFRRPNERFFKLIGKRFPWNDK